MKKLFLLILTSLLIDGYVIAQSVELDFNHLALTVNDLDESAVFYRDILSLKEIEVPEGMDFMRWFSLGNGLQLHLIHRESALTKTVKSTHLALTTEEFDDFLYHLGKNQIRHENMKGDEKTGISPYKGARNTFFQDPDGYWIEIREEMKKNKRNWKSRIK